MTGGPTTLSCPLLRHRGGEYKASPRQDAGEHLQQDQALVDIDARKRSRVLRRVPDRDCRCAEYQQRRRGLTKPNRGSDHEREEHVFERMMPGAGVRS